MATQAAQKTAKSLSLPPLPYSEDALAPVISARTLTFHHGKHHKAYVDKVNELVQGTEFEGQTLERIIVATSGKQDKMELFNNAAQAWNHDFYWHSLKPKGGGKPGTAMAEKIDAAFGSLEAFKKQFVEAAVKQFGSGWAWFVADGHSLKIIKTPDAELPLTKGLAPLLAIDVWEHAYYLDYQNKRQEYAEAVIDKLLDWEFAAKNFPRT